MEEVNGGQNHTQTKHSLERLSTLKRSLSLTGVKVPMRQCASIQMKLAAYLLNKPYSPNIVQDDANSLDKRVILLKEGMNTDLQGLPQDLKTWLEGQKESGLEVVTYDLDVDFKSYSLEQLMKLLLPAEVDTTLKIENIRDIKIFDLTEDQLKYKDLIGKIIIEKSTQKSQCILLKTRYRNEEDPLSKYFFEQKYELLSGEPNTEIEITEGPCTYKVDLLKVFYDSAFQEERERLLTTKNKDDIICDLFGDPLYSIRAAKENRIHIAANCNNDAELNDFYGESVRSNRVELLVDLQNRDLYPFVRDCLTKTYTREGGPKHVNHLHISKFLEDPSFLKFFVGLFKQINDPFYEQEENLPFLHFYIYVANEEFTDSMRKVLSTKFNNLFNEAFKDKEIKDLLDADDFQTIFIVHDDPSKRKLLHCTIKLSKKLAYCPEVLVEQVVTLPMQVEESKESNEPAAAGEAAAGEQAAGEPAQEPAPEAKSAKKSAPKKKKEIIHKPSKDAEALEKEIAPEDDGGLRRSSRKKTKSKQYDDYEYQHSGSKESSK